MKIHRIKVVSRAMGRIDLLSWGRNSSIKKIVNLIAKNILLRLLLLLSLSMLRFRALFFEKGVLMAVPTSRGGFDTFLQKVFYNPI